MRSREEIIDDKISIRGPVGEELSTTDNVKNLFLTLAADRNERILLRDFLVGLIDCTGVVTITGTLDTIDGDTYDLKDLETAVAVGAIQNCLDGMDLTIEPGEVVKFYAQNAVNEDKLFIYRYYWQPLEDDEIVGDSLE